MKMLLLILILSFSCGAYSQTDSVDLILKVKFIHVAPPTPGCGVIAWAATHKAKVVESENGELKTGDTILLIAMCYGDWPGSDLVKRKLYKVVVSGSSRNKVNWAIIKQLDNEGYPKYWIHDIKLV